MQKRKSVGENSVRTGFRQLRIQPLWALLGIALVLISLTLASLQAPHPTPYKALSERSWFEWLRYPIERNANHRLQVMEIEISNAIFLPDGQRGWAVGERGTILATSDGGHIWTAQPSGVQATLWSVQFNADGQRGWAVGRNGTILATSDGGHTWAVQPSGVQDHLTSVQFNTDGQRGWAVGERGTILATRDGGSTWGAQPSGVQKTLYAVQFNVDGQRGWAVGERGTILTTLAKSDGYLWAAQRSGVRDDLVAVQFNADGQRGWAVGERGTILTTSDGGSTWGPQSSGVQATLLAVQFNADGQRGWAVGRNGTILATNDGGHTWAAQSSGVQATLYAVQFNADGLRGWAVGYSGTILVTDDGGRTWGLETRELTTVWAVQFNADGLRGWAVGGDGSILATSDGGSTWGVQTSGLKEALALWSVHFNVDGQHGWAVGERGTILATSDGGHTWAAQTSGVQAALYAVQFNADDLHGWAVGYSGTILATRDGGSTWNLQSSGVQATLHAVRFNADGQRGWAVGERGTILTTSDGGSTWGPQSSGVQATLLAVQFNADGQRGWAVGRNGTILATSDGGHTWAAHSSGVQATLYAVQFNADGLRGWAVGELGTILATSDGGSTWDLQPSEVQATLYTVQFNADGLRGWTVDNSGTILDTSDGGYTWTVRAVSLSYSRYPAPWFGLSLIAAALCWRLSFRPITDAPEQGAEAMVATDAPTTVFAQDRLRFGPLAKGISRFLRNASTEPSLTLAISGDWGSGKSSLMALVCNDLRQHRSQPVWFNAWHHQKEEQLLAALLNAIQNQALPSSTTPKGWSFRLRLLFLRSKKHFLLAFVMVTAVSTVMAFLMTHDLEVWGKLWSSVASILPWLDTVATGKLDKLSPSDLGKLTAQLASGITVLVALRKALTAFGADPAVLLSATAEQFRLKDASALTNFRARFAAQFDEVTQCLPYRMVIVIDDLDRCRPESVLDVMEAVNFLVSSGKCFVIFGMATNRVQAALAMSFEKIAAEMVGLAGRAGEVPSPDEKERLERERRQCYARDYMEKLVNLDILVPTSVNTEPQRLLEPSNDNTGRLRKALHSFLSIWPLALCAVAIAVGCNLGARWQFSDPLPATVLQASEHVPTSVTPINTSIQANPPAVLITPSTTPMPELQPGEDRGIAWYVFAVPIGILVLWAIGFTMVRLRTNFYQVKDSRAFSEALRVWMPLVQQHRKTPRALKRFGNRIRYLAMLHQAEHLDESRIDALSRIVSSWWRRSNGKVVATTDSIETTPLTQSGSILGEDLIVALGALNEVCGSGWRKCMEGSFPVGLEDAVRNAIENHLCLGNGTHWPPTGAEMDSFETSLQGIRVPSK
ncbi:YCF48-related protein [Pseudomonas sp. B21-040]|uniref:YCF48-related protein n=1 Tax=Pseudomonas sp. B21-040 TaxID=2895486 RepID=UPI00215FA318|nr:YCF48-related protein [Pseudomonas sp. B21-040]UVL43116.1 YCF48-related protein [Pseudomonas sp. B21-040]